MTERTSYAAGTPSWVDVGTPDLDGAIRFYSDLLGWEVATSGEEFGYYSIAHLAGKTVAAIMPSQGGTGQPPSWNTYLASDNADDTAQKAVAGGAKMLMEPMDIADQGRMFFALDPTGAAFGVWQAGKHTGAQVVEEHGAMAWNELRTRDKAGALEFYGSLFPYEFEPLADDGSGLDYAVLKLDGKMVGGVMQLGPEFPADTPSHWMNYFQVDDCDAAAAKVKSSGGTVTGEPFDTPYGRVAFCRDPYGAEFSVTTPPEGAQE